MSKKTDHTPISHNFARIGGEIECVFIKYVGSKGLIAEKSCIVVFYMHLCFLAS